MHIDGHRAAPRKAKGKNVRFLLVAVLRRRLVPAGLHGFRRTSLGFPMRAGLSNVGAMVGEHLSSDRMVHGMAGQ